MTYVNALGVYWNEYSMHCTILLNLFAFMSDNSSSTLFFSQMRLLIALNMLSWWGRGDC